MALLVPALLASLVLAGVAAPPSEARCGGGAQRQLVCLLNKERARHGRPALRHEGRLAAAARAQAQDMASRGYFSHVSPSGTTPGQRIRAAGYRCDGSCTTGENIAWSAGATRTRFIVRMWMRSPGHRANVLSSAYRQIGVGIGVAGGRAMVVTAFGSG